MRIGFDASAILGPDSKNRGIGNYSLAQFECYVRLHPEHEFFLFNVFEPFDMAARMGNPVNFHQEYFYCGPDNFLRQDRRLDEVFGDLVHSFVTKNRLDVFYITSPFELHQPLYRREWFGAARVVATVYDVIPYMMRDHYLADPNGRAAYMAQVDMLRTVDRCLVISPSVKDDMVGALDFDPDRIDVIWGSINDRFVTLDYTTQEEQAIRRKFGISDPFVICTGGDDDRKNIDGLIRAFGALPREVTNRYQLVVVCKLRKEREQFFYKLAEECGVKGRVVMTNFVTDEELVLLCNLATLMAFPSKYEGFGLPVVEAWACGTPTLTSNNSSLCQIAGDAAVLVDPFNEADITRGLKHALTKADLGDLLQKGRERMKFFTWENVVSLMDEAILLACKEPPVNADDLDALPKRIAFFTPLPPCKSGIADYSADILAEMSKRYDIDVYVDGTYTPDPLNLSNVRVLDASRYQPEKYRETVYQVGNSDFHTYMFPLIKQHGGLVVLHDFNLHGVLQYECRAVKCDHSTYLERVTEDYPAKEAHRFLQDYPSLMDVPALNKYPVNGFVTNHAAKLVVHSDFSRERLWEQDLGRSISLIPHYAKISDEAPEAGLRAKLGFAEDDIIIATFGFVAETKRALPSLYAFKQVAERFPQARLVFVGKADGDYGEQLNKAISELGLKKKVTITGYTDLAAFNQHIDVTDVGLAFRHPFNGETSGSLMRMLSKGKCIVVNRVGSFAEVDDDSCVKIPDVSELTAKGEIDAIANALISLLEDRQRIASIGANARRYAQEHLDITHICRQYADAIEGRAHRGVNETTVAICGERCGYKSAAMRKLSATLAYAKEI